MFDNWGKWFRLILTVILVGLLIYFAPEMLEKLIEAGGKIREAMTGKPF